jgi:energy-coupling factor transporter ATP-binding protein EcfA2
MQFTAFRVFKYRNIEDSGLVKLADRLTCLVGKNQSGKTNLLKALQKLNPHDKSVKYDSRSDWPRGGRRAKDGSQVVCEAHFTLGPEKEELAALIDAPVTLTTVIVTKNYAGQYAVTFPEQPDLFPKRVHPNATKRTSNKLTVPDAPVSEAFFRIAGECVEEAKQTAQQGRIANLAVLADLHRDKLQKASSAEYPYSQNEAQFVSRYISQLSEVSSELAALPTTHQMAQDCIVRNLPTFIYMDDYLAFQGTANLDQVAARRDNPEPQDETLMMIFQLAGLNLAKLIEQGNSHDPATIRERQYDLQDAASLLTKQVSERWVQDPYKIQFRADGQRFFTEIEQLDKNIGMLPLEEQSQGFQWFFSFDLRFMHDSGGTFAGCVLLLDEPGMHLHPGGQDDLLKRFDAYAQDNTLIYTTHLPFLVDIREPSRILIMKECEDRTASVTDNLGGAGPNEKLTMQAALGMKASQHQLAAEKNLVVAGPDAYAILSSLSNLLERSGRIGLDENITLLAADDAAGMPYLVSFLIGQGLEVIAMFESDAKGREEEEKLRTKWIPQFKDTRSSTVLLGDALGVPGDVSIEDMFSDRHYLSKATEVHATPMQRAGAKTITLPTGAGTLLERVARGFADADVKFDKDAVSRLIRRQLREQKRIFFLSDISGETTNKAERLFAYLNGKFSAQDGSIS